MILIQFRVCCFALLAILVLGCPAGTHADAFSFDVNFDAGMLNHNFSTNILPGFGVSFSGRQAVLSQFAGYSSGFSSVYSNFQLLGNFSVTVAADRSMNTTASSGLELYFPPYPSAMQYKFADIYFLGSSQIYGNAYPNCCAAVSDTTSSVLFQITRSGNTINELYNSGNGWTSLRTYTGADVAGPADVALFIIQEGGQTNANQVNFQNLSINSDSVTGVTPVPEPSGLALLSIGLAGFWRTRRTKKIC